VVQQTLQCIIQVGERNMLAQPPDWSIKVEVAEVKTSKTSRYKARQSAEQPTTLNTSNI